MNITSVLPQNKRRPYGPLFHFVLFIHKEVAQAKGIHARRGTCSSFRSDFHEIFTN